MALDPQSHPETILQHWGEENKPEGAVVPPIFQNSLFVFEDTWSFQNSFSLEDPTQRKHNYSRVSNPTLEIAEKKIAALEKTETAKVFGSGMAAISAAIMSSVEQGRHIVCVDTAYGPTKQFIQDYLPKFGVQHTYVEGSCSEEILDACLPETSLIYLESPSSLLFKLQDFRRVTQFAQEKGVTTVTDNSYCSPFFQNPAEMGVDIVVHSATKYLGGHSDVVAGALACSHERMTKLLMNEISLFGGGMAPFPAWLLIRGMRTLALRMRYAEEAGHRMAAWLGGRSEVARVFHAGAADHPQRELATSQMRGSSSLLSFEPVCQDEAKIRAFADALHLFQLGVSWGGFESLCVPIPMQPMGWNEPRWIIRLYVGLENPEDLEADLSQAFEHLR